MSFKDAVNAIPYQLKTLVSKKLLLSFLCLIFAFVATSVFELIAALPLFITSVILLILGLKLFYLFLMGKYVVIDGNCVKTEENSLHKCSLVYITVGDKKIKFVPKSMLSDFSIGAVVRIYIPLDSNVKNENGILFLEDYYAYEFIKN